MRYFDRKVSGKQVSLKVLVLSEDTGQGHETVCAVLEKVLLAREGATQRIEFLPSDDQQATEAMYCSYWKSEDPRFGRVNTALRRMIANKLALGWTVIFHFDGDTAWEDRMSSDNVKKFERLVRANVKLLLGDKDGQRIDDLVEVTPFYSIEAWTYQSTSQAQKLCKGHGGSCQSLLGQWGQNRHELDEVIKVKDQICFKGKHNADLARHIPSRNVVALRKSFTELVRRLASRPQLAPLMRLSLPLEPT